MVTPRATTPMVTPRATTPKGTPSVTRSVTPDVAPTAPPVAPMTPDARALEYLRKIREPQPEKDAVIAVRSPGESTALSEYLNGRAELANLIADVEARMPSVVEPAPAGEAEPQSAPAPVAPVEPVLHVELETQPPVAPQPEPQVAAVSEGELSVVSEPEPRRVPALEAALAAGAELSEFAVAQNTKLIADAVEQVTRASELIARACELFTERVESDRQERRALLEVVTALAQQLAPAPATPRLVGGSVFATPARPHEIVIDDDRSDAPAASPASASTPAEQPGTSSTRTGSVSPRPSTWSAAQTPSTPPTSLQPKAPRFPSNRSGR
jgi:hypothetical protein